MTPQTQTPPEGSDSLDIEIGWPAQELSPNARVHPMVKHRFSKAAKIEAGWATKIAMPFHWQPSGERISVHLIAHPPKAWRTGDDDNLIARVKSHLDGIASVLGVNDREFMAPTVEWADRCERGKLIVRIS
jgi:crossover junction endodeoxyribonuclease RusA